MGGSLSVPITSHSTQKCGNESFKVGVCEMQGYRATMEDSHRISLPTRDQKTAFFAIYDGHGGEQVKPIPFS